MSISVIHNNYYAQFVSVHFLIQENIAWGLMFAVCLKRDSKSIFFATTTTIHISGLIKVSPHVRESKTVLDSGFHAVDSGFQLLGSRSYTVELGFQIPIVSGIPDSHSCIPDPRPRILDSTSKNFQDSGF